MDHREVFTHRLVAAIIVAAGFALWLSCKTKKPVVALVSSLAVVALVFGGLAFRETYWPSMRPSDRILAPFGHQYDTDRDGQDQGDGAECAYGVQPVCTYRLSVIAVLVVVETES